MNLLKNIKIAPLSWSTNSYDQWVEDIRRLCGRFTPVMIDSGKSITGIAHSINIDQLQFNYLVSNLDYIYRSKDDITGDSEEFLSLIVQVIGKTSIEHMGENSILTVGDCFLVDVQKPIRFDLGGCLAGHLSFRIPRLLMYGKDEGVRVGHKLSHKDPMAHVLHGLLDKIMTTDDFDQLPKSMHTLLLDAVQQSFIAVEPHQSNLFLDKSQRNVRLAVTNVLIDRYLTEDWLTSHWLATKIGISLRTLQEDFTIQVQHSRDCCAINAWI